MLEEAFCATLGMISKKLLLISFLEAYRKVLFHVCQKEKKLIHLWPVKCIEYLQRYTPNVVTLLTSEEGFGVDSENDKKVNF